MENQFTDLTITGVNKDRSEQVQGAFYRIFLQLSAHPPGAWAQLFDGLWLHTLYSMKRRAGISGDEVWIECVPEEIKQYHLSELKKVVSQTNNEYKIWVQRQESQRKQVEAQEHRQREQLGRDLDGLDFD
jgi:hypothetical protein